MSITSVGYFLERRNGRNVITEFCYDHISSILDIIYFQSTMIVQMKHTIYYYKEQNKSFPRSKVCVLGSVDSLCRDGTDTPFSCTCRWQQQQL